MKEVTQLLDAGGILIGSRALGVENDYSDYDVAILRKNLPKTFCNLMEVDVMHYFNLQPVGNMGHGGLIKIPRIDILLYHDEGALNAIKEALNVAKQCPVSLLKNKSFRIMAFENALINTGLFT